MSCNRENVVWKTANGTWGIGFFSYEVWGDDHEWDVDYDYSRFFWASTGHTGKQAAISAWHGANPGAHEIIEDPNDSRVPMYDAMAEQCLRC